MEIITQMLRDVTLPRMIKVQQHFYAPEVGDVAAAVNEAMIKEFEEMEPKLLEEAKSLMPQIMFDPIDVLVDEIGQNISGDGMDPNTIGRYGTPCASGGPQVARIVVLGLTEATEGNANGIGLADLTTRRAVEQIQPEKGFVNAISSTVMDLVKEVPLHVESEELAVKAAIKTCNAFDLGQVRLVDIKNNLDLKEIWISESLLPEAQKNQNVQVLTELNYTENLVGKG